MGIISVVSSSFFSNFEFNTKDSLFFLLFSSIHFFCFAIRLWLAPCLSGASSALTGKGCFFCNVCQPLILGVQKRISKRQP